MEKAILIILHDSYPRTYLIPQGPWLSTIHIYPQPLWDLFSSLHQTLPPSFHFKSRCVQFVLLAYAWLCGQPFEHGQPTRDHIPKENWFFLLQQLSIANISLAKQRTASISCLRKRVCFILSCACYHGCYGFACAGTRLCSGNPGSLQSSITHGS